MFDQPLPRHALKFEMLEADGLPLQAEHKLIAALLRSALKDATARGQSQEVANRRDDAVAFWRNQGDHLAFWSELLGLDIDALQSMAARYIESGGLPKPPSKKKKPRKQLSEKGL